MGDYEPITKGLRDEMAHGSAGNADVVVLEKTDFEAFCDNIDAIHRALEQENERLRDASERGDDWIKLPLDADRVPIREGDELWSDNDVWVKVKWLEYKNDKWAVFVENKVGISFYAIVEDMHHYRPDTWESIIDDAVKLGFTDPDNEHLADKLVARCKTLCERTREGGGMSRTDLDATTLANSLRMMAGDGSIEWAYEPIQASVLLDIADMLDENAKLRKLLLDVHAIGWSGFDCTECPVSFSGRCEDNGGCKWLGILADRMRELGIEVGE